VPGSAPGGGKPLPLQTLLSNPSSVGLTRQLQRYAGSGFLGAAAGMRRRGRGRLSAAGLFGVEVLVGF